MSYRLRSYDLSPPGGYQYPGFAAAPMIEALARQVSAYRRGNKLERSSYRECLEDISCYQCERLKNNPAFCVENTDGKVAIALADNAPGLAPCATCGAPLPQ